MEFHDCQFVANVLGSVPAVAINVANLTVGQIILTGDTAALDKVLVQLVCFSHT